METNIQELRELAYFLSGYIHGKGNIEALPLRQNHVEELWKAVVEIQTFRSIEEKKKSKFKLPKNWKRNK